MNTKNIFRTRLTQNFTTLPNALLQESRLSFRARGILALILSMPDHWEVHQGWIQEQGTEGREAVSAAFRELEQHGYAVFSTERDGGRITRNVWTFHDKPTEEAERTNRTGWKSCDGKPSDGLPCYGKPCDGKPSDGNPTASKDYTRKDDLNKETTFALFPEIRETSKPKAAKETDADWLEGLKQNPAYRHIDQPVELGKMKEFLKLPKNKGRQMTRAFILNWFNRNPPPVEIPEKEKKTQRRRIL